VTATFSGHARKVGERDVLTWLTIAPGELVVGFRPGGVEERVPLAEVMDVRVVGRGGGRVPWSRHAVRGTSPNPWANGDTGRALRICRRQGPDVYVTLDDPFAARDAVAALRTAPNS
jgi:hypothetical protein